MKRLMLALLLAALLLCACGGTAAPQTTGTPAPEPTETPDLAALCEALRALFPEMMEVDPAMRLDFLGIQDADCAQCVALLAADGTKADELWLLEAVDDNGLIFHLDKNPQLQQILDHVTLQDIRFDEHYVIIEFTPKTI